MNLYNHISYLTKEQSEQLFIQYPEFYAQAANIAENFGIVPQQVDPRLSTLYRLRNHNSRR